MKRIAVFVCFAYAAIFIALTWPSLMIAFFPVSMAKCVAVYSNWPPYWILLAVLVFCQAGLLLIPLRITSRRPIARKHIFLPVIVSGLLIGALSLGVICSLYEFVAKGLRETLDAPTIVDCVQWADGLSGRPDDAIRFESFLYYVRFDACLPQIGAPEPPPWDETRQLLDLEFYDGLGSEDSSHPWRRDGCSRGAVQHSVLCKRHHFEMVKHRECPF